MKEIKVRMTDAMADALTEQVAKRGQAGQRGAEAALLRELLYAHLNKAGHSATSLSLDDAKYAESRKSAGRQLPTALWGKVRQSVGK